MLGYAGVINVYLFLSLAVLCIFLYFKDNDWGFLIRTVTGIKKMIGSYPDFIMGHAKTWEKVSGTVFMSAVVIVFLFDAAMKDPQIGWLVAMVLLFFFWCLHVVYFIGYRVYERYLRIADNFDIKKRVQSLFALAISIIMITYFGESVGSWIYRVGILLSCIFLIFVVRSILVTLTHSHIRKIAEAERAKALFFIATYWLVSLLLGVFLLVWNFNGAHPGSLVVEDKGNATVANLLYFTVTSITTFGSGDLKPADNYGQLLMAIVALLEFAYLVFFVNAFMIAYTDRGALRDPKTLEE